MKTKQDIKLIPIKIPNFNISNSIESLIEMLKEVIVIEETKENIIGIVDKDSKFYCDEDYIYGDIIFKNECDYDNYEFVNYGCEIDNQYSIVKFNAIYFGIKGE